MTIKAQFTPIQRPATGRGGGLPLRGRPPNPAGDRGAETARPWPGGLAFFQGGQRYTLDRLEPHKRRDGETVPLVVLATHCAECGEPFEVRQPIGGTAYLTRRCEAHRAPGKKARG